MSSTFLGRVLQQFRRRARAARAHGADLGASALEWAIIAAIVVVAASVIGGVLFQVVEGKTADLQACAEQTVDQPCAM